MKGQTYRPDQGPHTGHTVTVLGRDGLWCADIMPTPHDGRWLVECECGARWGCPGGPLREYLAQSEARR